MNIGTKSLLFGVHQFLWHPFTVWLAWRRMYGGWTWRQLVAIVLHDVGYWGCSNIDGPQGKLHPLAGAALTRKIAGEWAALIVLLHSRDLAKTFGQKPSVLCWPDKYSINYDPKWFFLLRGRLSGELKEFKANCIRGGHLPADATDAQWFDWYRARINSLPEVTARL